MIAFLRLNSREDVRKIEIGTNVKLLDMDSYVEGGLLARCMDKFDGLFIFAVTPGFQFIYGTKNKNILEQSLYSNQGFFNDGKWFFDGSNEGALREISERDKFYEEYYRTIKEISDYVLSHNKNEIKQLIFG